MKIYTFHEPVKDSHNEEIQLKLLQLWKDNWVANGWEPVVVNNDLAQAHPMYEELVKKMTDLHVIFTGEKIKQYGIYCYTRWLAYAMLEDNVEIFTCDYDLVNNGLQPEAIQNKKGLNLMSEFCPCFVSGMNKDFQRLVSFMIKISELRFDSLRGKVKTLSGVKSPIYHDQDVLVNSLSTRNNSYGPEMAKDMKFNLSSKYVGQMANKQIFDDFMFKKQLPKTLHFSRNSMLRFKKEMGSTQKFKNLSEDALRVNIIKEKFTK